MHFNNRKLDIWSRGEITDYLKVLLKKDQIKDCQHLKIDEGYLHTFKTECMKQYASRIPADNVHTDPSAGGAPSSYFWPKCPKDCPYYLKSEDFYHSLNSEVEEISNYKSTSDNFNKVEQFSAPNAWAEIEKDFEVSKRAFGKKINFVKNKFKRNIIFRDIAQAYFFAENSFNKPAVILAGGVIEELLRLYLKHKEISPSGKSFNEYIISCDNNGLFKKGISKLSDSLRDFRNIVHLEKEESSRYTISKATAKGAISSIFTISNDF
ncbi:unnamed protein product [marine sediment metagenome]|uniref:DUF4145 domain-containing protein n=1 Tax=marine sediment metagenome TaxID=412755 RepID=X1NHG6_9ZZZZ